MTTTSSTSEEHKLSDLGHRLEIRQRETSNSSIPLGETSTRPNEKSYKTENFQICDHGNYQKVTVLLNPHCLVIQLDGKLYKSAHITDILGATSKKVENRSKRFKIGSDEKQEMHVLKIHLLIKQNKNVSALGDSAEKKPEPRKYDKWLLYNHDEGFVSKWRNLILQAANNPAFHNLSQDHEIDDLPDFKRTLLVFVNAKSGPGKAKAHWATCRKLLVKAGCTFKEVFVTDSYEETNEILERWPLEDLQKFDAIVSVSGDGFPHNIINKFYKRPEVEELMKIPIMLIPGGSCNALTQNALARSGEDTSLESCCYLLSKGRSVRSDITVYEFEDGTKIYSFLSISWASPANIDLDSETLRGLGCVRFDIYGLWEVLTLKRYKAKFSYSNTEEFPPKFGEEPKGSDWVTIDDDFNYFSIHNMPWMGLNFEMVPFAELEDGANYCLALKGEEITRMNLFKTKDLLKRNPEKRCVEDLEQHGLMVRQMKAFRLEPYGERVGKYSIDGEVYEAKKLQGYVKRNGMTLVAIKRDS